MSDTMPAGFVPFDEFIRDNPVLDYSSQVVQPAAGDPPPSDEAGGGCAIVQTTSGFTSFENFCQTSPVLDYSSEVVGPAIGDLPSVGFGCDSELLSTILNIQTNVNETANAAAIAAGVASSTITSGIAAIEGMYANGQATLANVVSIVESGLSTIADTVAGARDIVASASASAATITTDLIVLEGAIASISTVAAGSLLGNLDSIAGAPSSLKIGTGFTIVGGTTLNVASGLWNVGAVSTLGAGLALSGGTLTNTVVNTNIWNAGTVSALGTGISVASGTLYSSGLGGTITEIVAGTGLEVDTGAIGVGPGGTITQAGTLGFTAIATGYILANTTYFNNPPVGCTLSDVLDFSISGTGNSILYRSPSSGWVTLVLGTGLAVSSGSLTATGGTGTVTNIVAGAGLSGGTIAGSGTISLSSHSAHTLLGNYGSVSAVPGEITIGSGLSLSSGGVLSNTAADTNIWNAGTVSTVGTSLAVASGTINIAASPTFTGTATLPAVVSSGGIIDLTGAAEVKVPPPTGPSDAATRAYVDLVIQSLQPKPSPTVATTANLTGTYANGSSGLGATFTLTATGVLTIDGYAMALGDRVLFKNQTTGFQNGLYDMTTAGAVGVAAVLTRNVDMDTTLEFASGLMVTGPLGAANNNTLWVCTNVTAPTVGTTAITFTQLATPGLPVAGTGITVSGTTVSLSNVSDKTILSNISGSSAAPVPSTLTAILDNIIGSNQGAILTRQGTAWAVLNPGTAGQALVTQGTSANAGWTNVGSIQAAGTGISISGTTVALASAANNTVKGNISGGSAAPIDLTTTQLTTLVNPFTSGFSGAVSAGGSIAAKVLHADNTWALELWSTTAVSALGNGVFVNSSTISAQNFGTVTCGATGTINPAGIDMALVNVGTVNTTLSALPGFPYQRMRLNVAQGTTAHTVTMDGTTIVFSADVTAYTAGTIASKADQVMIFANSTGSIWTVGAINHGCVL